MGEGYCPRFGIVHVDFATQKRIVKDSGKWFMNFKWRIRNLFELFMLSAFVLRGIVPCVTHLYKCFS